jgi:hypothetical protein
MDKGLDLFICLIPHLTQTFDRHGHHRPSPISHTFLSSFPLSLALPNKGNPHYAILDVIRMIIIMTSGGARQFILEVPLKFFWCPKIFSTLKI